MCLKLFSCFVHEGKPDRGQPRAKQTPLQKEVDSSAAVGTATKAGGPVALSTPAHGCPGPDDCTSCPSSAALDRTLSQKPVSLHGESPCFPEPKNAATAVGRHVGQQSLPLRSSLPHGHSACSAQYSAHGTTTSEQLASSTNCHFTSSALHSFSQDPGATGGGGIATGSVGGPVTSGGLGSTAVITFDLQRCEEVHSGRLAPPSFSSTAFLLEDVCPAPPSGSSTSLSLAPRSPFTAATAAGSRPGSGSQGVPNTAAASPSAALAAACEHDPSAHLTGAGACPGGGGGLTRQGSGGEAPRRLRPPSAVGGPLREATAAGPTGLGPGAWPLPAPASPADVTTPLPLFAAAGTVELLTPVALSDGRPGAGGRDSCDLSLGGSPALRPPSGSQSPGVGLCLGPGAGAGAWPRLTAAPSFASLPSGPGRFLTPQPDPGRGLQISPFDASASTLASPAAAAAAAAAAHRPAAFPTFTSITAATAAAAAPSTSAAAAPGAATTTTTTTVSGAELGFLQPSSLSELSGQLEELRWLASGSSGRAYTGLWKGSPVAVKVVLSTTPDQLADSAREALLSRVVSHPAICQCYTVCTEYITTEHLVPQLRFQLQPGAGGGGNTLRDGAAGPFDVAVSRSSSSNIGGGMACGGRSVSGSGSGSGVAFSRSVAVQPLPAGAGAGRRRQLSAGGGRTLAGLREGLSPTGSAGVAAAVSGRREASGTGGASARASFEGSHPDTPPNTTSLAQMAQPPPASQLCSPVARASGNDADAGKHGAQPPPPGAGPSPFSRYSDGSAFRPSTLLGCGHKPRGIETPSGGLLRDLPARGSSPRGAGPQRTQHGGGSGLLAAATATAAAAAAAAAVPPLPGVASLDAEDKDKSGSWVSVFGAGLPVGGGSDVRSRPGGGEMNTTLSLSELLRSGVHTEESPMVAQSLPAVLVAMGAIPGRYVTVMVMEWCNQGTLLQAIRSRPFAPERTPENREGLLALLRTALEIAQGMRYLHSLGIIHGDLKPSNVLLQSHSGSGDGDGPFDADLRGYVAKVADFGLASPALTTSSNCTLGAAAAAGGQPGDWGALAYLAPEVPQSGVSKKSDVYAFGCLLYHMCTGKAPFQGIRPGRLLAGLATGSLTLSWPDSVYQLLRKLGQACCAARPPDRPSFDKLVTALQRTVHHVAGAKGSCSAGAAGAAKRGSRVLRGYASRASGDGTAAAAGGACSGVSGAAAPAVASSPADWCGSGGCGGGAEAMDAERAAAAAAWRSALAGCAQLGSVPLFSALQAQPGLSAAP